MKVTLTLYSFNLLVWIRMEGDLLFLKGFLCRGVK